MNTLSSAPRPVPAGSPGDALWRLAYAITGDRAAARAVVAEAHARVASGRVPPARLRGEVVALARAWTVRQGGGPPAHHDRLWTALRPLPRRVRAGIVQRLREAGSAL